MKFHYRDAEDEGIRVTSEFADIRVSHGDESNGCQLRVTDLRTGNTAVLDALQLEALTRMPLHELVAYLVERQLEI